jgi:nitrate/nitrite transport system substrate-binding protein
MFTGRGDEYPVVYLKGGSMGFRRDRSGGGETRREFLRKAGQSALVLSAASFGDFGAFFQISESLASTAPSGEPVSVGIMAPSHCAAPYAYAAVKEIFAKNGVDARLVSYQNMPLLAQDLIDGKIQVGQLISPLFLSVHFKAAKFKDSGVPLVTPMFTGTNGGALMVSSKSPAMGVDDLGGMTIGSHSKLTIHYLMLMNMIKSQGLSLKEPIKIEILPLQEMVPSLASGKIQGFIMPEPINAVAEAKGAGRVLQLTRDIWPNHPCCLLAATRSFAEKRPEALSAVSLSVLEAALFAGPAQNREAFIDTIRTLEPYGKMKKELLLKAFAPGRADFDPFPYRSSARTVATMMRKFNLLPDGVALPAVEETFNSPGARKLFAQAGAEAPRKDYREELIMGKELKI